MSQQTRNRNGFGCSLLYGLTFIEWREDKYNERRKETTVTKTVETGVSFGSALAMVISYANWHSIGWAILHGILGWIYVIYYAIKY